MRVIGAYVRDEATREWGDNRSAEKAEKGRRRERAGEGSKAVETRARGGG